MEILGQAAELGGRVWVFGHQGRVPAVAESVFVKRRGSGKGVPGDGNAVFFRRVGGKYLPGRLAAPAEGLFRRALRVHKPTGRCAALQPSLDRVPERAAVKHREPVHHHCVAVFVAREGQGRHFGIYLAACIGGAQGGDVVGFHLQGLVGVGASGVQKHARQIRPLQREMRPVIGRKEGHRALEIAGVHKQRPRLVAGGHIAACGGGLGAGERQRQVAIAKELALAALLEVQAIERPHQPGAELRHAVLAFGLAPIKPFAAALAFAWPVGPLAKVQPHAAHAEFGRLRFKMPAL